MSIDAIRIKNFQYPSAGQLPVKQALRHRLHQAVEAFQYPSAGQLPVKRSNESALVLFQEFFQYPSAGQLLVKPAIAETNEVA